MICFVSYCCGQGLQIRAIGSIIRERYLSGEKAKIESVFGNSLPQYFKEPSNYDNFEIFKKKAIDISKRDRDNDTEVKFIFNFLEEHWNSGNRFVINMESTLYTCTSCQGYFVYLKELAKQEEKILEIKMIANKRAKDTGILKKLIK
ncbi:hypothetical protein [Flavobacterium sp.]|uniref:hypothetical protein n=1 Tax=Flavobacterium sp. TaxID=239 RepID=UPI0031D63674